MDSIRRKKGETTLQTSNQIKDKHRGRKEGSGNKQGWRVS